MSNDINIMKRELPTGLGLPLAVVTVIGLGVWYANRDVPEKLHGFPEGAELASFYIPTSGDVTDIWFPEAPYGVTRDSEGEATYRGNMRYCIRPEGQFAPQDDVHTDARGNVPWGPNGKEYWCDTRLGRVTVKLPAEK